VALAACLALSLEAVAHAQQDAPTPDPLVAARALFAEALADQQAGRAGVALDKFRRVRAVRDSPSVEYRIGSCEEGLGHPAAAYGAYQTAVTLGEADASMADVVAAARARLEALSKHVAKLTLVVPADAAVDLTIDVDADDVPRAMWGRPLALEPGTHTVVAARDGRIAFRGDVALPEGGEASLPVALSAAPPADHPASPAPAAATHHALGAILVGSGAVLLAGAGGVLFARHEDIGSLDASCPGGTCPADQRDSIDATRARALAEGPVAAGLAIGGAAAAAVGLYFVLKRPASTSPTTATVGPTAVTLAGTF
jgi:hypothetical protein